MEICLRIILILVVLAILLPLVPLPALDLVLPKHSHSDPSIFCHTLKSKLVLEGIFAPHVHIAASEVTLLPSGLIDSIQPFSGISSDLQLLSPREVDLAVLAGTVRTLGQGGEGRFLAEASILGTALPGRSKGPIEFHTFGELNEIFIFHPKGTIIPQRLK